MPHRVECIEDVSSTVHIIVMNGALQPRLRGALLSYSTSAGCLHMTAVYLCYQTYKHALFRACKQMCIVFYYAAVL